MLVKTFFAEREVGQRQLRAPSPSNQSPKGLAQLMSISRTSAPLQRCTRALRSVALSGLLALGMAAGGPVAPARAASAAELERQGVTQIIVKRRPDLTAVERADVRADADVELVRQLMLPRTEVVSVERGELAKALAALRSDPDVVYAEPDAVLTATADPFWDAQWGLENSGQSVNGTAGIADADVDALDAWRTTTGAGQTVAVIDSGLEFGHPDLAGQVAISPGESGAKATNGVDDDDNGLVDDFRGWDWVGKEFPLDPKTGRVPAPEGADNDPSDVAGHGTHVAGIIAAKRDNSIGVAGVAPAARVLPLRVLDSHGGGLMSDAVEALYYAGRAGARVANASLGVSGRNLLAEDTRSLHAAMAANKGTLYVFAAGNANTSEPFYPCAIEQENVLCVGASTNVDARASFSNYGAAWVDLYAPGQHIHSTYRGGYAPMSGTSMSAPLVAGTVALVAAADPTLGATALRQLVLDGADRKTAFAESVTRGRLNAAAAVALAKPPATSDPVVVIPPETRTSPPADEKLPTVPITEPSRAEPVSSPAATPAPPAPATPAPAPASNPRANAGGAPVLSNLALSSRSLRRSLTLRFRVDRATPVRLTASRKECRAGRCRYRTARTWTVAARPGANSQVLRRSAGGRRLAAGTYRLSVQAVDGAQRSAAQAVAFSVR